MTKLNRRTDFTLIIHFRNFVVISQDVQSIGVVHLKSEIDNCGRQLALIPGGLSDLMESESLLGTVD